MSHQSKNQVTNGRKLMAAVVGLAVVVLFAASSQVPWNSDPENDAELVLSWRGVSESNEQCRVPTEEDLSGLPPHMRPDRICEQTLAAYQLTLALDGTPIIDRVVAPAGARGDRPVYVLDRLPVSPGTHRLRIDFVPVETSETAPQTNSAAGGLRIDETVTFEPGRIVLVTRDGDRGDLVIRTSAPE